MRCFLIFLSLTLLLRLSVSVEDNEFEEAFEERQVLGKKFSTRRGKKSRRRNGEVEMEEEILVRRDEILENAKRMDNDQDEEELEGDVEKREQVWMQKHGKKHLLNRGEQEKEVLVERDDVLENAKRMDNDQVEEEFESDVEKREQVWMQKNGKKHLINRGEQEKEVLVERDDDFEDEKRMDDDQKVVRLEKRQLKKRQLNKFNERFKLFGRSKKQRKEE